MTSARTPGAVFITFHSFAVFLSFLWFVLLDLYMYIQSYAIDCILHFFPCNLALACEYSHFSWLLAAWDVLPGETSLAARSQEKRLYSQANLADTGIQLNSVYTRALKSCTSLPSFGIRGRTIATARRVIFCHFRSNFFPYYELRSS